MRARRADSASDDRTLPGGMTAPGDQGAAGPLLPALRGSRPRIAVFRGTPGIGDLLCAVPSWRALRAAVPDAHVTLIGQPWTAAFAERLPTYLDDHLAFPGFPGIPDAGHDVRAAVAFLAEAQRRRFDLVLQQHGDGTITNLIVELLGARHAAGFHGGRHRPGRWFVRYPAGRHEIHRHLLLLEHLGAPSLGDHLELPVTAAERRGAAALAPSAGPYVVLHPGAKAAARRWPAASFAALGAQLCDDGLAVVVTGSEGERRLARDIADAAGGESVAGATTLGELAALVDGARVVVTNDTGTSHVAVARQVPSVVVVPGAHDTAWLPLDRRRHRVVAGDDGPAGVDRVVAAAVSVMAVDARRRRVVDGPRVA
jgi:ADP-heptose:LPS heptosyltransferase